MELNLKVNNLMADQHIMNYREYRDYEKM